MRERERERERERLFSIYICLGFRIRFHSRPAVASILAPFSSPQNDIYKGRKKDIPLTLSLTTQRSRDSGDAVNPGNNLYVTGLSTRVTDSELEKYFNTEGKVLECHLVMDPRTRESRGFGFVTMETVEDADRCVKYLNRSVLEGRLITVQKAKRKRGRTPTPGRYHGVRENTGRGRRRSPSYSPRRKDRERSRSRGRRERSRSPYGRRDEYLANKRRRERSLSDDNDVRR
ncbi:hypothetical protein MRB53_032328 [Persea americana]|uniref:Uncharacterized protein n=1 Tax=Persea americana TaxID=3435 RepID=A0ACC2KS92_PERAE|nr:hypothetical protein MRB53_032328 [Persea americana]